jgi:long-chain acyl-CoA synthetase
MGLCFLFGMVKESVAVPIDFMSSAEDVSFILNDCKPEIIFIRMEQKKSVIKLLHC